MALRERLIYAIDVITDGARNGLNGLRSSVSDTNTTVGKFKTASSAAFEQVKANAATMALAAGAALVTFGVKSVTAFQNTALEAGKFSDATRLSVEDASRWIEVAGDMGIESGTIQRAFVKLNKELADGSPVADRYGLALQHTADGAVDVNATMLEAIEVVKGIKDPTERAAAAQTLFGRSYAEVAELIETDSAQIVRSLAAVSDSKVIDEDELAKARKFRESMDELQDKLQDLQIMVGEKVVPVIVGFVEGLEDLDDAVRAVHLDDFAEGLEAVLAASPQIQALSRALGLLADDTDNLSDRTGELSGAWEGLKQEEIEAAEALSDNIALSQDMTLAQRLVQDAIDDATESVKEQDEALHDATDAAREMSDQLYGLHDAEYALEQSIAGAIDALADEETTLRGARDAMEEVASNADAVAQKQVELAGATLGTKNGNDIWIESMLTTASTLSGPLKDELLNHISRLSGVPVDVLTQIGVEIDAARLAEIEADLNFTARERFVRINPITGGRNEYARGTKSAARGLAVVGEDGPEVVKFNGGETVYNASESRTMLSTAGSGSVTGVHIQNAYFNNGTDEESLARRVMFALQVA